MFLRFFENLRAAEIPVSLREFLSFLEALKAQTIIYDVEGFYYLARLTMVKDERFLDRFDVAFSKSFEGVEAASLTEIIEKAEIPDEWLRKMAEKTMSAEEMAKIESLGGFEALMETLKKRLEEQEKRHQGGNKWIGTAGTSPFGAYGYNPEGIRIGQHESRHRRAVKVWDRREFRNLDDSIELGTRNIKMALKRLRSWARQGADDELDLDGTIKATAEHGYLDVKTRPERRNSVKVLLFLDVGGSMDDHIAMVEELFSAARSEFKHMEYFYFHNCLYEGVWKDNSRRWNDQMPMWDVLHTYASDYKCIFVGDASMSPYEVAYIGGANEHYNKEAGSTWLQRAREQWPNHIWINPVSEDEWQYTHSIGLIREIFEDRMVPMTLEGIEAGMKQLGR